MLASGDKEVVLAAVKQNGLALEYASKELQNDREVVLAAVKQDGRALEYASDELKSELKKEANND
jgi:histidinol phosphatase-like PHP family hydrolase